MLKILEKEVKKNRKKENQNTEKYACNDFTQSFEEENNSELVLSNVVFNGSLDICVLFPDCIVTLFMHFSSEIFMHNKSSKFLW